MKFDIKEEDLIIKPYKHAGPIYIREQKGYFQRIRRYLSWFLMLVFIGLPWITYQGQQAILFDVAHQKFKIFGATFLPQDFMLLAGVFMAGAFALFFVTNWLGRVWCGFVCPQTVWMLMFTWVEHKVEGTRNQRIKLDQGQWNLTKIQKKLTKHSIWLFMSLFTATSFMAYFIPASTLYTEMFNLQWSGLVCFWVFLFTLCTYGNAGFLREKMCTVACPYSRFQSVMFDKDTLVVSYDFARGERRGRRKRKDNPESLGLGDCVDCNLCVEVCPAGIDIRNGLQYECINCGLCIDACDQTMDKFGYKKGLISFKSEQQMAGKQAKPMRLKLFGYAILTVAVIASMIVWLLLRTPLEVSVIRDRNALYRLDYQGIVENPYTLSVINKTQQTLSYNIALDGFDGASLVAPSNIKVAAGQMVLVPVTISADQNDLKHRVHKVTFIVSALEDSTIYLEKQSYFYSE
ncbi:MULTISPECIES: cytochrome c oxidase accessory protein CcoG [Pseudoalteromonas]|uniref:Cytochrome c oxidase accessory protein CcoG n=1 Tax=Pseudoalteromonas amylolytica TaxID=1859457 RepID=A0A1S1MWP3_9GAMM|nr:MULTISPECIES: cytochrome c oxidase accessory protein CcoG [Pseudoalteromonas]OHU87993.1 cytochrome c oxidase accessory protein CcoG [Pseudoalteromonas sp. JW3]OHU91433.1 cytochrome c oxidase accessory protein CcoG [Pseudoalteromonas amylolytica]